MLIYNSYKLYESRCMVYPNRIKPFWMLIKYLDRVLVSWNQSQHRLQVEPQRTNVMIFKSTIKLLSQTKSTFIIIFRYRPYRNIFRSILYWIWFKSYNLWHIPWYLSYTKWWRKAVPSKCTTARLSIIRFYKLHYYWIRKNSDEFKLCWGKNRGNFAPKVSDKKFFDQIFDQWSVSRD